MRYVDEVVCRDRIISGSNERLYALQDANFNLTCICDTNGSAVERYRFSPYGDRIVMNASWTALTASVYAWVIGHQGLTHDSEIGLIHNRDRIYVQSLGVFSRRDPVAYVNTMNLYLYLAGNPVCYLDPDGRECIDLTRAKYEQWLDEHGIKLTDLQKKMLDRGCVGIVQIHQGSDMLRHPEDYLDSKCYLSEQNAKKQKCKDDECPVVFAKQGDWKGGKEPTPDPDDATIPTGSVVEVNNEMNVWNYVTVSGKCYVYANQGELGQGDVGRAQQVITV
jgi:RHS repeat-associated protein